MSIEKHSVKSIDQNNFYNTLQKKYKSTEQRLISLLGNSDSSEYKKCYAELISLDIELDQLEQG